MKNAEDMTITCRAKTILLVALQKAAEGSKSLKTEKVKHKFLNQVRFRFK